MTDFAHLHVHTTFSFLDGMCAPKALAARAAELQLSACAVTDHRHLGGAIAVYQALKAKGVKPILGMEADVRGMGVETQGDGRTYHVVLLAKNVEGYRQLMTLATKQLQSGVLGPADLVGDNLLALTSCCAGEVAGWAARGNMDRSREALRRMTKTFGVDNVYVELQPTAGPHLRANPRLIELAQGEGVKTVVTNDVHYLRPEHHHVQNVLMAMRQGKKLGDKGLHQHPAPVYYLRSGQEMLDACAEHELPMSAFEAAMEIAERCSVELSLGKPDLPPFSDDDAATLASMAWDGLRERGFKGNSEYEDRLTFELQVIVSMGFPGYFLIVQDFVNWARDNGVSVGPGRGSGAGSLVAYCLGITDLDPIEHQLLFERFLNPERVSMPDFDIDFAQAGRKKVMAYVVDKYGRDHVGQIATYMALHPKSAIKDTARTLGMPFAEINDYTRTIPQIVKAETDEDKALSEFDLALKHAPALVERAKNDRDYANMLNIARQLTGCYRQTGLHAGGVVIGRLPLTEYTPLTEDGATQYDMNAVEAAGLVKFDFLGVKTLDVVDAAAAEVGVDVRGLQPTDPGVYEMIAKGDTWGLFQIESPGMTTMCKELLPDRFDDIVAGVSLFRPGPMQSGMLASFINRKHGREEVEYAHPLLSTVLEPTYGTFVYQEQVMEAARVLAGYTLGGADLLRRAMGKKKPEEMAKQRQVFVDGCAKNGIDSELATSIFDSIETFAGYGFNRSHAAAYAMITYQTAWLKLHHPLQFTAALLTVEGQNQEKLAKYVRAARESGIMVVGPDVNLSAGHFIVEGQVVRWGLSSIKGLGDAVVPVLVAGQPYTDLYDLAERSQLPPSIINVLIDAGACDQFGVSRARLKASLSMAGARRKKASKAQAAGQTSMFGVVDEPVTYADAAEEPEHVRLEAEFRVLGTFLSGHPTSLWKGLVPVPGDFAGDDRVAGVVVDAFVKRSKKDGRPWARVTIEDDSKTMNLLAFPDAYPKVKDHLVVGRLVLFGGYVNREGEFVVQEVMEQ